MAAAFRWLLATRGDSRRAVARLSAFGQRRNLIGLLLVCLFAVWAKADRAVATSPLDHFTFYNSIATTGSTKFYRFGPVQLTDQFRSVNFVVMAAEQIGLPADKNSEGVFDPNTHLRQYKIKLVTGETKFTPTNVRIINQCSDALIRLQAPTSVLLPTNESLTDPVAAPDEMQHQLDHFICYPAIQVTKLANGTPLPRFPKGMQVDVVDQFQSRRYDLKRITRLCKPVAKQEDPQHPSMLIAGPNRNTPKPITPATIRNPTDHLVCYAASLARSVIQQNGCGAVDPNDRGASIFPRQPGHSKRIGVYVNDQFGPGRLNTLSTVNPRELCIPSSENQCGNGVAESPEACDGTDNAACGGLPCRADCSCTPSTCGDNVQSGPAESCDGTDNAACGGLPCLPDCSCTPPSCGDNITNEPIEDCDGTDDSACPGQCQSFCRCPGPACTEDPARTIFTGPSFPGCRYFDGDRTSCQSAYALNDGPSLNSCYYSATGLCLECFSDVQATNDCTNSCQCGNDVLDPGEVCDGSDASVCPGQCQSDCRCPPPPCTQDPTRTFVGWLSSDGCGQFNGNQVSCEGAYVLSTNATPQSCFMQSGGCIGCADVPQSNGECANTCACGNNVIDSAEECDGTSNAACGGLSCRADCRCTSPSCGDDIVNQSDEECDGTSNADCGGLSCRADCTCTPPSCGDNIVNQDNEACDGTDDSACPSQCQGGCTCP